jgi:hypothetical protein
MSKLPPFSFAQRGYSIIRPQPKPSPLAKEIEGADELTLAALADLQALIEAKGDQVSIVRGDGIDFFGAVVVADPPSAIVLWDEKYRKLIWLRRDQTRMRGWPSYLSRKMLGRGLPEFELGSEWRVSRFEGVLFYECEHSPKLLKCQSPIAERFAERYNSDPPTPTPKLKKTKKSDDDDEGNIAHALRPHIEEFTP